MAPTLSDLRYTYFGGGAASEYAFLLAAQAAGVTAEDLIKLGYSGSGSPEGVVTAPVGSLYIDTDNGSVYSKTAGTGNIGWAALAGGGGGGLASVTSTDSGSIDFSGLGTVGSPLTAVIPPAGVTDAMLVNDKVNVAGDQMTGGLGINYNPATRVGIGSTLPGLAPVDIFASEVIKPLSDSHAGLVIEITDATYEVGAANNYGTFPIMVLDKHSSETIMGAGGAIRFYVTANGDIQGQGWQHIATGQADPTMRGGSLPNQALWVQPGIDIAGVIVSKPSGGTKDLLYLSEGSTCFLAVNAAGQTRVKPGVVGTPAVVADGDLDTGVYFPAANTVGVAAGGVAGLSVTSTLSQIMPGVTTQVQIGNYFGLPGVVLGNALDTAIYRIAAGVVGFTSSLEMTEMTAPAAGGANTGRLYLQDNGAGKTQLMVKFNTGAAIQLAIQP
jgi:hypothetical protein